MNQMSIAEAKDKIRGRRAALNVAGTLVYTNGLTIYKYKEANEMYVVITGQTKSGQTDLCIANPSVIPIFGRNILAFFAAPNLKVDVEFESDKIALRELGLLRHSMLRGEHLHTVTSVVNCEVFVFVDSLQQAATDGGAA